MARARRRRRPPRPGADSRQATGAQAPGPSEAAPSASRRARSEERNAAARAALEPLAPGERPRAVTVAAVVAAVFALANAAALVYGLAAGGAGRGQTLALQALVLVVLLAMAVGMWGGRYWAVLGMQALLGVQIVFGTMFLVMAGGLDLMTFYVLLVAIASGTLFWFLVKAMARLQMPSAPVRDPRPPAGEPRS